MIFQYLKRIRFVLCGVCMCAGNLFSDFLCWKEINLKAAGLSDSVVSWHLDYFFFSVDICGIRKPGRSWNICCKEKDLMRIHFRWHKMELS